jgi:ribosomal protein S18 acetylase RimI-like enzyme
MAHATKPAALDGVTIRPVTLADLPAVRAALIETWHATYDALYGRDKVIDITTRWHNLLALAAQVDQTESAFLLAEDATGVCASSFASLVAPDIVHLYRLYVRPSVHGRGIGTRLMAETVQPFPAARVHRLEVEPRNTTAIAFYERHGFKLAGQISDCGGSSGVAALILERRLT